MKNSQRRAKASLVNLKTSSRVQDNKRASKFDLHNASKDACAARIQRNKMVRDNKRAEILKEKQAISAPNSPPRIIANEVDAPLDVAARKQFAKYKGLKSFLISSWDPKEFLPPDYSRIFASDNF